MTITEERQIIGERITLLMLLIAATVATIICCFRPVPAFGGEWLLPLVFTGILYLWEEWHESNAD